MGKFVDASWKAGKAANKDRKITVMRAAKTSATYKTGMGGLPKSDGHAPRPITLPKMPWDMADEKT